MNITKEGLRAAIRRCTPGAPDSYTDRIWAELVSITGAEPVYDTETGEMLGRRNVPPLGHIYGRGDWHGYRPEGTR